MSMKSMLHLQKMFNEEFLNEAMPEIDLKSEYHKEQMTQYFLMLMMRELMEVYDETNFKRHVFKRQELDHDKIKEELIDCFKFLLNMFIVWDMNADSIYAEFLKKHAKVNKKWRASLKERNEARKEEVE